MIKYFYSPNGIDQNGPFSFEEIKRENIKPETLIWCEGMNDWKAAVEVPKFKTLFKEEKIILSKSKNIVKTAPKPSTSFPHSSSIAPQKKTKNLDNQKKIDRTTDRPVIAKPQSFSWWRFDDEYITGWQYLGRSFVSVLLAFILVGFYLSATTAYKRAKSLGKSESTCTFFGIWGGLSLIIGLTPAIIINLIPNVYLWASSGRGHINKS
jgi:hypothetical protein